MTISSFGVPFEHLREIIPVVYELVCAQRIIPHVDEEGNVLNMTLDPPIGHCRHCPVQILSTFQTIIHFWSNEMEIVHRLNFEINSNDGA